MSPGVDLVSAVLFCGLQGLYLLSLINCSRAATTNKQLGLQCCGVLKSAALKW
jgi:hypothetical protein